MLKFIFISLLFTVVFALNYYTSLNDSAVGLVFKDHLIPIVLNETYLEVESHSNLYRLDKHFLIASRSEVKIKQQDNFDSTKIAEQKLSFVIANNYLYRNIDLIINVIEKPQDKIEVYIDKPIYIYEDNKETIDTKPNDAVVSGIKDLKIAVNTSFEDFLEIISRDIKSDVNVMIDYTNVNLSVKGNYPIYYHTATDSYCANVSIV